MKTYKAMLPTKKAARILERATVEDLPISVRIGKKIKDDVRVSIVYNDFNILTSLIYEK